MADTDSDKAENRAEKVLTKARPDDKIAKRLERKRGTDLEN
jgi:hypothetical protein